MDERAPERLPVFARGFPADDALAALVRAFAAGDHARVRREAPALAERSADPAVAAAARELRRRVEPDRLAVALVVSAGLLLAFLSGWFWLHGGTVP